MKISDSSLKVQTFSPITEQKKQQIVEKSENNLVKKPDNIEIQYHKSKKSDRFSEIQQSLYSSKKEYGMLTSLYSKIEEFLSLPGNEFKTRFQKEINDIKTEVPSLVKNLEKHLDNAEKCKKEIKTMINHIKEKELTCRNNLNTYLIEEQNFASLTQKKESIQKKSNETAKKIFDSKSKEIHIPHSTTVMKLLS